MRQSNSQYSNEHNFVVKYVKTIQRKSYIVITN